MIGVGNNRVLIGWRAMKDIAPRIPAINNSIDGCQVIFTLTKTIGHAYQPTIRTVSVVRIMISRSWMTKTGSQQMGK